ncbi:MAG TPA: glycosyltransferase [Vicinamibacterales bacterium]|nr:glycosyltransferase [Vicinamibacterales bacterium]
MTSRPPFTIVLPCFNEGRRIASSLATLDSWFGSGAEILVVDDGSGDDTTAQAERWAASGRVRVHRLPAHRGKGAAIRAAMPLVGTDRVVFMDADLAFDRASVERILDALESCDMAIGSRRLPGSFYTVPVGLFRFLYRRHVMGLLFNAFVRLAAGVPYGDTQCGLKGFRRGSLDRIAPALTLDGFALDVEMLVVAEALGMHVREVPVHVQYESAKSSVRLIASGRAMLTDIAAVAVRRMRGAYSPSRLHALGGRGAAPDHAAPSEPASRPTSGA